MLTPRDTRFVWVTWLAKLMVGDISCEWAPWLRSNFTYTKAPSDFDDVAWRMAHTRLLRDIRTELAEAGFTISVERQNQFRFRRKGGLMLSGTPDLIAVANGTAKVVDAKTGQPRASDSAQVLIYMHCIPLSLTPFKGLDISGELVYPDRRVSIPPSALTSDFAQNFDYYLDLLDTDTAPLKVPSYDECRFCDISKADCPERVEAAPDYLASVPDA